MKTSVSDVQDLIEFFAFPGFYGIAELLQYLSEPHEGNSYVVALDARLSNFSEGNFSLIGGKFSYQRDEKQPFKEFHVLADAVSSLPIEAIRIVDMVFLQIVAALELSEEPTLFTLDYVEYRPLL